VQVGEKAWSGMSQDEREGKIDNLSAQVKELMDAGRYDDALQLLGDGLTEEQKNRLLAPLLGDVNERRKNDLAERERRFKERTKEGGIS